MSTIICLPGILALLLIASAACHDVTSVLMQHIERLESKVAHLEEHHSVEIRNLKDKLKQQDGMYNRKIAELDKRLAHVEEINSLLVNERDENKASLHGDQVNNTPVIQSDDQSETDELSKYDSDNTLARKQHQERIKLDNAVPALTPHEIQRQRKALGDGTNIAFSAYMDKDADGMGAGQVLVYNQVLLNDGNGYNKHTGIFTAPIAGVYSFSFFIGQRGTHDALVALMVNSEHKVEAVVETRHTAQDLQGGNTVNLKIAAGDTVFVKNPYGGSHVEGSNGWRITTFSGFLVYPVETTVVVGK